MFGLNLIEILFLSLSAPLFHVPHRLSSVTEIFPGAALSSAGLRDVLKKLSSSEHTEFFCDEPVLSGHLLLLFI